MLEWSFKAFVEHWKPLALIVLILRGPITILAAVAGVLAFGEAATLGRVTVPLDPNDGRFQFAAGWVAVVVVLSLVDAVVLGPAFTAALNRATVGTYLGDVPGAPGALRYGFRKFGSILLITILLGLVLIVVALPFVLLGVALVEGESPGGLILLVVAAMVMFVFLVVRLNFASLAFVAEGHRGRAALLRSWRLVDGRFWKVFGVTLLGSFLGGIVFYGVGTLTNLFSPDGVAAAALIGSVGTVVAGAIVAPFTALLATALFFAVRASKEPFDATASLAELRQRESA